MEFLLHALIDSLKVLTAVLVFHILFSFVESKISKKMSNNKAINPILGSAFGLIPQCGFSVLAADMYIKEHITTGTLIAVFIACSDEALPILLSNPEKAYLIIPMILAKFCIGFIVGYIVDLIIRKDKTRVHNHLEHCHHEEEIHVGCCNHEIDNEKGDKINKHLIHPLIHSLKIFIYVFIVNAIFGFIIHRVGEDVFASFLTSAKYFGPLISTIIGLIPNCASSVIIAELFVMGNISFGTALAGLIVNVGVGSLILFKHKEKLKSTLMIMLILIITSVLAGYITNLIFGF